MSSQTVQRMVAITVEAENGYEAEAIADRILDDPKATLQGAGYTVSVS